MQYSQKQPLKVNMGVSSKGLLLHRTLTNEGQIGNIKQ